MNNKQDKKSIKKAGRPKKTSEIQTTFVPKFWTAADGRLAVVKELKRRVDELKVDSAADSVQKNVLCERAIFIQTQIEGLELDAIEGKGLNHGVYIALVNSLMGVLKLLGIEKRAKKVMDLKQYIKSKDKDNKSA